jgi:hypothetical protein
MRLFEVDYKYVFRVPPTSTPPFTPLRKRQISSVHPNSLTLSEIDIIDHAFAQASARLVPDSHSVKNQSASTCEVVELFCFGGPERVWLLSIPRVKDRAVRYWGETITQDFASKQLGGSLNFTLRANGKQRGQ